MFVGVLVARLLLVVDLEPSVVGVQNLDLDEVEEEADNSCHHHPEPVDHRGLEEPLGRLHQQPYRQHPDYYHARHRPDDLRPVVPVRQHLGRWTLSCEQAGNRNGESYYV